MVPGFDSFLKTVYVVLILALTSQALPMSPEAADSREHRYYRESVIVCAHGEYMSGSRRGKGMEMKAGVHSAGRG